MVLLDEAYVEFLAPEHRTTPGARWTGSAMSVRTFSKAYGLAGCGSIWLRAVSPGRSLWRMQLLLGIGLTALVAAAASYDSSQPCQRIRVIAAERRFLPLTRLRAKDSAPTGTPTSYLPAASTPWRNVFDDTGLQVRHYADGGSADHRGLQVIDPRGAACGDGCAGLTNLRRLLAHPQLMG